MIYITNAFSLQMLQAANVTVNVKDVDVAEVAEVLNKDFALGKITFAVGHADTAAVATGLLNEALEANKDAWIELRAEQVFARKNIQLQADDVLYVLQLTGGRLPEGATTLPEGFQLSWKKVCIADQSAKQLSLPTVNRIPYGRMKFKQCVIWERT